MVSSILIPVLVVGGMGLIFEFYLVLLQKVFAVKEDERVPKILEVLPGSKLRRMWFCRMFGLCNRLCKGGVKTNMCPVGGDAVSEKDF